MKKFMAMISSSLLALLLVFGLTPMHVKAADKTYTVTFRAGNVGEFHEDAIDFETAEQSKSFIKIHVNRGESIADYFGGASNVNTIFSNQNLLATESAEGGSYRTLPIDEEALTKGITRNTDIVMDYCRVVNPARYAVFYINGESGAQIASPVYGLGEADEVLSFEPLTITGYNIPATKQEVTLQEGKTAVVTFAYSMNETVVYNTEVAYTDGDIAYNDLVTYIGQPVVVAGGPGAAADADADAGENLVEVDEAETPLANNTLEDNGLVELEENETPLSNQVLGNTKLFAIIAGFAVLLAVGVAATLKIKKKAK